MVLPPGPSEALGPFQKKSCCNSSEAKGDKCNAASEPKLTNRRHKVHKPATAEPVHNEKAQKNKLRVDSKSVRNSRNEPDFSGVLVNMV